MLTLPYTSRDYEAIFEGIKEIIQTIEPKADVELDRANVESIIARIISGCVDTLSYNQDSNILEAFPSTAKNPRSVFDLLSIVGYTPKTARACHVYMALWNPSFIGEYNYKPFNSISIDSKTFFNPDEFRCAQGITTKVDWYQGTVVGPDLRPISVTEDGEVPKFIDDYYPNLSINTIKNNLFSLPEEHTQIDSRTLRIYNEEGNLLTFVENPYMTNITKNSFSLLPSVNRNGYSLMFSKDVSGGACGENFYYWYIMPNGESVGGGLIPDFGGLAVDNQTPSFSYSYDVEPYKAAETAQEARENIVYEFGWRDTPKAIITKPDAERAVLQNFNQIAAVTVRDGNDYSGCDPSLFDVQIFCKVNETFEQKLSIATADGLKNQLMTHFNKFKALPLSYQFHIDNIQTGDIEAVTQLYYWYPNITIYLKEQVNPQEAAAILNSVGEALYNRFSTINTNYNETPRIVDIIETVENSSEVILYLDIDGLNFMDSNGQPATKEDITCSFTESIPNQGDENLDYELTLNTKNETRPIMFNSIKIVNNFNEVIGFDNGDGTIIAYNSYMDGHGTVDYKTGKLTFKLNSPLAEGISLRINYKQETPCFCEYVNSNTEDGIKIALESLKKK